MPRAKVPSTTSVARGHVGGNQPHTRVEGTCGQAIARQREPPTMRRPASRLEVAWQPCAAASVSSVLRARCYSPAALHRRIPKTPISRLAMAGHVQGTFLAGHALGTAEVPKGPHSNIKAASCFLPPACAPLEIVTVGDSRVAPTSANPALQSCVRAELLEHSSLSVRPCRPYTVLHAPSTADLCAQKQVGAIQATPDHLPTCTMYLSLHSISCAREVTCTPYPATPHRASRSRFFSADFFSARQVGSALRENRFFLFRLFVKSAKQTHFVGALKLKGDGATLWHFMSELLAY
jgi:hypothetical protein